uniref:Uncharacterized protein n=1 Tax=Callorhinchus milii TaxID=7868 RepID=A0A4W3I2F8_CALMI
MKSMLPGARSGNLTYGHTSDPENLVNGNHPSAFTPDCPAQSATSRPAHTTLVSSIEKDLQDIMDSLALEDTGSTSPVKLPPAMAQSPLSPVVNGGIGRYLLSPPMSPGGLSAGSSYDNMSPPFSPLSSPSANSSAGSCTSQSPSNQDPGPLLPPTVPVRSSSYNHNVQPPAYRPVPVYAGPGVDLTRCNGLVGGQRVSLESPRALRKASSPHRTPP